MTAKSLRALFWKEFRQQYLLATVLFAFCVIVQLLIRITMMFDNANVTLGPQSYFGVSITILMLYVVAATSILFSKEHEEQTYSFLRMLPITKGSIVLSKLGWVVVSTVCLALGMGIVTMFFYLVTPERSWEFGLSRNSPTFEEIVSLVSAIFAYLVICFCWGLFWTTHSKSQMMSFLLTVGCIFGTAGGLGYFTSEVLEIHEGSSSFNTVTIAQLIVAILFGGVGLWSAWEWIARKENRMAFVAIKSVTKEEKVKLLATPVRGEFRWLLWQTYRQSRWVILYTLGFGLSIYLVFLLGLFDFGRSFQDVWNRSPKILQNGSAFVAVVWWIMLCITPFAFCGSVFFQDHQKNAVQMLGYRGVSPGKVWWSRICVFGATYFWLPVALLLSLIVYVFYLVITRDLENPVILSFDTRNVEQFRPILAYWVFAYFGLFVVGQFVSLYVRSMILAIFSTALFCWLLGIWASFLFSLLNLSPSWTLLPILIACLVSSRLRAADWLRGRNTFKAHVKSLIPVIATIGVIIIAVPLVRVYSVPMVSLGFPRLKSPSGITEEKLELNNLAVANLIIKIGDNPTNITVMRENWSKLQKKLKSSDFVSHFSSPQKVESIIYKNIEREIQKETVSPEYLKAAIAFLEAIPRERASLTDIATRFYEALMIDVNNNIERDAVSNSFRITDSGERQWQFTTTCSEMPMIYRVAFPWEKARIRRMLNSQYQSEALILQMMERSFDQDNPHVREFGTIKWPESISIAEDIKRQQERKFERFLSSDRRQGESFGNIPYYEYVYLRQMIWLKNEYENGNMEFRLMEDNRRALLFLSALHLWWQDHDKTLPESLDQLKGDYLTELPKRRGIIPTAFELIHNPEDGSTPVLKIHYSPLSPFPLNFAAPKDEEIGNEEL